MEKLKIIVIFSENKVLQRTIENSEAIFNFPVLLLSSQFSDIVMLLTSCFALAASSE